MCPNRMISALLIFRLPVEGERDSAIFKTSSVLSALTTPACRLSVQSDDLASPDLCDTEMAAFTSTKA